MFQLQQKKTKRVLLLLVSGSAFAFSLFLIMYLMIKPGDLDLESLKNRQMIDFIRIKKDDTLNCTSELRNLDILFKKIENDN